MVVRFMPSPDESITSRPPQRNNLAEVVDIRSRLVSDTLKAGDTVEPVEALSNEQATHSETSPNEFKELPSVHDEAVKLLSRKALSSGELRRDLIHRGHPQNDVEDVLADFIESYYLDDLSLARTICEKLRDHKRASTSQIRRKLQERLLDRETIEEVLSALDADEEHDLLVAAAHDRARRLTSLDRSTAERRLLGFLARRGWGGSTAVQAARDALDEFGV